MFHFHCCNQSMNASGFPLNAITEVEHVCSSVMPGPFVSQYHSVSDGNILRRCIGISDDGADFTGIQERKRIVFAGFCCFNCISLMPVFTFKQNTRFPERFRLSRAAWSDRIGQSFHPFPSKQPPISQSPRHDSD